MPTSALLSEFQEFRQITKDHVATKLLHAHHAAVYCAVFAARFLNGEPVIPGARFMQMVAADLRAIAVDGPAISGPVEERVAGWVRAGYLIRSIIDGQAAEQYQLSVGAAEAIDYLRGQVSRVSSATESTMTLIVDEIVQIDIDSNPDSEARIKDLRKQQAALQHRIAAIENGSESPIDTAKIIERFNVVHAMGARMPTDVARFGEGVEALDRRIRTQPPDADNEVYADVLRAVLDGEDALTSTDEGRSFQSFFTYLTNPRLRARLDAALASIGARDIPGATNLVTEIEDLITAVAARAREVKSVQGTLNRSLRRFIQNREYLVQQQLRDALTEGQRLAQCALSMVARNPTTGLELALRRATFNSIGGWRLQENFGGRPPAIRDGQADRSGFTSELSALFPVDRAALKALANEQILSRGGAASCGEIIRSASNLMHLAEVTFLCELAVNVGLADPDGTETVTFSGLAGPRSVRIPYFLFTQPVDDSLRNGAGGTDATTAPSQ